MSYTMTANDEVGDEFVLQALWRERREEEAQFKELLKRAPMEDGCALFHPFDYAHGFRRWLLNRSIGAGYTVLEMKDVSENVIRVRLTRPQPTKEEM